MTSAVDTGTAPAERVIARLRPHARAMFWPSIALIATCAVVGYLSGRFSEQWENTLVVAAGGALVLLLFLLPFAFWLSTRYIVTTRRLIVRHGFFVRIRQELLHSRGYDVSVARGPMQMLFRSGTVTIDARLDRPYVLLDVPRADVVAGALRELMEHSMLTAPGASDSSRPPAQSGMWGAR